MHTLDSDSRHPRLTPNPRGTVSPTFWGDGSRFAASAYAKPKRKRRAPSLRASILADL